MSKCPCSSAAYIRSRLWLFAGVFTSQKSPATLSLQKNDSGRDLFAAQNSNNKCASNLHFSEKRQMKRFWIPEPKNIRNKLPDEVKRKRRFSCEIILISSTLFWPEPLCSSKILFWCKILILVKFLFSSKSFSATCKHLWSVLVSSVFRMFCNCAGISRGVCGSQMHKPTNPDFVTGAQLSPEITSRRIDYASPMETRVICEQRGDMPSCMYFRKHELGSPSCNNLRARDPKMFNDASETIVSASQFCSSCTVFFYLKFLTL